MLAAVLGVKEIELDESEAKQLADATKKVLEFYPLGLNPKHLAVVNLVFVAAGVYGTRAIAYNMRRAAERSKGKLTVITSQPGAYSASGTEGAPKTNGFPAPASRAAASGMPQTPMDIWPERVADDIP
jgi:hypothetical protein